MAERDAIAGTPGLPPTPESLADDLAALGVRPGMVLLVHASLSALGWVVGGAPAVIAALTQALGPDGTLVMPAHSGNVSDPAGWIAPPIPTAWHALVRDRMPAFDPVTTPTSSMGAIAESFRTHPGTLRSIHPRQSFAARGRQARDITAAHALDCALGERSPLARLYALDAMVLLLGVGHDRNTSLHLAEHRATYPGKKTASFGSPVRIDGERQWLVADDLDFDDSDFAAIGGAFERDSSAVAVAAVGYGTARLMRQRSLVDFGVRWMTANRMA